MIKQKLYSAIDALSPATSEKSPIVLFLPVFEDHEIGLLMANYILRQSGRKVIYLGSKVPLINIKDTVIECNPSQLLFFPIQTRPIDFLQNYINQLSDEFKDLPIFVTGNKQLIENISLPSNIKFISNPEDLAETINVN